MSKRIRIQIFADGKVLAEVQGVKGSKCTDYIQLLEDILAAETVGSKYTSEYYESCEIFEDNKTQQKVKGG
ncbi:DUF2997 domain-containing protein [Erysipelotrichia bacterium]